NRKTRNISTSGNFSLTADTTIQTPLKPRLLTKRTLFLIAPNQSPLLRSSADLVAPQPGQKSPVFS
ncbi:hypothetical protein N9B27_01675, partial [Akkermansiaceae bacterium]|nr:hypothetical protein [Akkermansiaceae bacterium]